MSDREVTTTSSSEDRFVDPGLPPHKSRMGDTDPRAAKRSEMQVVILFVISIVGTIGSLLAYFLVVPDGDVASVRNANLALGVTLFLSLMGIGLAAIHWAKTLMSDHEVAEERHPMASDAETRAAALGKLQDGAKDSNIARRTVLKGSVVTAVGLFPLTIAVPLIGSVGGDWDVSKFKHTLWEKGKRLTTDPAGRPVKASDVTIGSVVQIIPEASEEERSGHSWITEKAKAVVMLVRMDPADLKESEDRKGWSYNGIVAYSKICTHVGCPVALYEQQTHHVLCPCHQSTFDVSDGAKVVFGPAKRPLPQLPIAVDNEGYLVAQDDFNEPVGPSYWERLK
ncbi:ubiquinol-cytochrome c reductase iron-sulfur subunit [Jonesia quinghaiensis]|uniref:cytochrome bc1 complex Rieske iron-sulfur subunit n=1 Tax=Jonesia quinghaiensis TaxID=262806 RepID=UPI0003FC95BE|nr:Rieske 2Fe-2S domain-containing protein [Jonesia quinghaiensis]